MDFKQGFSDGGHGISERTKKTKPDYRENANRGFVLHQISFALDMTPSRMKFFERISAILFGLALTGCSSPKNTKLSSAPAVSPSPTTSVAAAPASEEKPLPPRPRPNFGSPPQNYDPLASPHPNLFDPSKLGQPDYCCPIHGFNPPIE
jgi:hypothetical protein